VVDLTAVDVGARLICIDPAGRLLRVEEAGRRYLADLGLSSEIGAVLGPADATAVAEAMAERLFEAMQGGSPHLRSANLLRLAPLSRGGPIHTLAFSGGVSEYIYGRQTGGFGDLGPQLAAAVRARAVRAGATIEPGNAFIRATVIGASQYTTQVSGSTIYVAPLEMLPLRNVPVIAPQLALDEAVIDRGEISRAILASLGRLDLAEGGSAVAVFLPWRGSATFARLDACCRGLIEGLAPVLSRGHPLVLVGDGDVGGLLGIHCREELKLENGIVSVDGLDLKEFDYIDIGRMIATSGAVPVVIKSLIFPQAAVAPAA
jgi:ethanolamine utilization protein EutA